MRRVFVLVACVLVMTRVHVYEVTRDVRDMLLCRDFET